jgi:hypothetical protein
MLGVADRTLSSHHRNRLPVFRWRDIIFEAMTKEDAATRLVDAVRGCIVGGAIGDSMGGPFEGQEAF